MKTIETINLITGEYQPGDVVVHTSKVGAGKTNYMVLEAVNAAINGHNALLCSMEVKSNKLQNRVSLATQNLIGKENPLGEIIIRDFKAGDFSILERIATFVNTLKKEGKKPEMIFIDCFELSFNVKSGESYKDLMVSRIKQMKEMAGQLGVVFIINLQANSEGKIRYSDELEGLIDFIILLRKGDKGFFTISPIYCRGIWKDILIRGKFDFENMKLDLKNLVLSFDKKLIPIASLFKEETLSYLIAPAGEGKSTFSLIVAEHFSEIGKRVCYIGEVNHNKKSLILKRIKKNLGNIYFTNFPTTGNFLTSLRNTIEAYELDTVFIDDSDLYTENSVQEVSDFNKKLKEIAISKKCAIIAGSQTRTMKPNVDVSFTDVTRSVSKVSLSDTVLSVRKYRHTWFKRLLEKIMFWRPKTNFKINVLKNRIGSDGQTLYANVDFENNKIKVLK